MTSARLPLVAVLLAACLGAAALASVPAIEVNPANASDESDADRWDPRLRELVAFVETTRGPIRFPAELEFIDRSLLDQELNPRSIPTGDSNPIGQALGRLDDADRALGLANVAWTQDEISNDLSDGVAAFFDPNVPRMVVALDGPEPDELEVTTRIILAHELVHAFQYTERLREAATFADIDLAQALIEGEAEWVMTKYIASLPDDEQATWRDFLAERRAIERTPSPVIDARLAQSYALGLRLHQAAEDLDGADMFSSLMGTATARNRSTRSLIDPYAFASDSIASFERNAPDSLVPFDAIGVFHGPLTWFRVFATAVSPADALVAARQTSSVRAPTARVEPDGSLCVTALILPRGDGREQVLDAAEAWEQRLPDHRSVRSLGLEIELDGCDPGPGAVPAPALDPLAATMWLARYIDAEAWLFDQGQSLSLASCVVAQLDQTEPSFDRSQHWGQFVAIGLDGC